ncbi:MAG: hypothetical protein FWE11_03010 [Defluviitaleaceae bacterium]|nr:hypothetical protein [Defluviitaleaceae bacterium]
MSKALKDYVSNVEFINKMNSAFSDLRADYELSMDVNQEKIAELVGTHVDVKNQLTDLISFSRSSSGVVSGLRGTGKTHLLLLARNKINQSCFDNDENSVFCAYLNIKRLALPENCDQDLFNRIFSVYIYSELSKQLSHVLISFENETLIKKLLNRFNKDRRKLEKSLHDVESKLVEFSAIARNGNSEFKNLSIGTIGHESGTQSSSSSTVSFDAKVGMKDAAVGMGLSYEDIESISKRIAQNNTYLTYLNYTKVRDEIISLLRMLGLKGITFYIDEWEKISYEPKLQEYLSFFIDRINDDPFYFWISVVPNRGGLYHLKIGADLQHLIDLDDSLVYENSSNERDLCLNYFQKFVDNRLKYYFGDEATDIKLFNNKNNFEKLVLASMGNSRDFGTMLLKCWSEFQSYRTSSLSPGRPFQYISENMVISSIKNSGDKKKSNIQKDTATLNVLNDIETFCTTKKSSHFAVEESRSNIGYLARNEFSDLIYHRLIHLRKRYVPAKDTSTKNKLSIYALDYSSSYNLHSQEKRLRFITEYKDIHDKVRRYIYDPKQIVTRLQIENGEVIPCPSCNEDINIIKMVAAWKNNYCPFCDGRIRNEN